jgi:hypothetical protein
LTTVVRWDRFAETMAARRFRALTLEGRSTGECIAVGMERSS